VLHVYRTYFPDPPGGLQEAIRQIALGTHTFGVNNIVFTLTNSLPPFIIERPEATVIRRRSWCAPISCDIGGFGALSAFASAVKTTDIIHYHFPWPFADLLHLMVARDMPAVLTWHSDIVRQKLLRRVYAPLMTRMLASVRAVVATSEAYTVTSPILSKPTVRDKVRVISYGIDEASYPTQGDKNIISRLGLDGGIPYFLFLGVLRYYKGVSFLIDAARGLNAKVVIAGEGPMGEKLREQAQGVDNVVFAGRVSDQEKVALLKRCRALVLPSHLRSEAFGMVLIEAAMFGKPMISCEIGTGTSFVNVDGKTGIVVPPATPSSLAEAMCALLDDETMASQMGIAARKRYERLFSGSAQGQAYERLYREILT
jgi:rhamnosyl/mannosyltransferase